MRIRSRDLAAVLVATLLALSACGSSDGDDAARTGEPSTSLADPSTLLAPADFKSYMNEHPDAPVVNVHVPYEGHIAGTDAFVPYTDIADWSDLPAEKDATIVMYCRSGNMSGQASRTLAALGYTDIVDLAGGMNAWTAAGFPLLDEDPAGS